MWKKDEVKIQFVVTLKEVKGVDMTGSFEGAGVWVSWKRGSKDSNKGDGHRIALTKDGSAVWSADEQLSVESTLFQDQKTKEFKGKNLEVFLKEVPSPSCVSTQYSLALLRTGTRRRPRSWAGGS